LCGVVVVVVGGGVVFGRPGLVGGSDGVSVGVGVWVSTVGVGVNVGVNSLFCAEGPPKSSFGWFASAFCMYSS